MAGIGFLWVPINSAAYSFLKPEKSTQASGFLNLSRNVGGGVGIALATTILSRASQAHQSLLSSHLSEFNPAYSAKLAQTANALTSAGLNASIAASAAPGMIYQEVSRQASMLAYLQDFRLMAICCFASLAVLVFLKRSDLNKASVSVH
jgi:DHA2 family multidrug resistance protein